jgi:hypothetical protein
MKLPEYQCSFKILQIQASIETMDYVHEDETTSSQLGRSWRQVKETWLFFSLSGNPIKDNG